jgi:hypothetical protein
MILICTLPRVAPTQARKPLHDILAAFPFDQPTPHCRIVRREEQRKETPARGSKGVFSIHITRQHMRKRDSMRESRKQNQKVFTKKKRPPPLCIRLWRLKMCVFFVNSRMLREVCVCEWEQKQSFHVRMRERSVADKKFSLMEKSV